MTAKIRHLRPDVGKDVAVVIEVLVRKNCPQEDAAIRLIGITAHAVGV
jgi:hypothetical protein